MSRGARLAELLSWLGDAGAEGLDSLVVQRTEALEDAVADPLCEEYAVFVTRDVGAGECVLGVPLMCLITVEMGMCTDIGEQIMRYEMTKMEEIDVSAPKHCFLSIFLLTDRLVEDSWYQPYYRSLPDSFPNIPLYWSIDDLKFLRGSHLLYLIKDRLENLELDYRVLCEAAPSFAQFTLPEFIWARMVVASRNFGIEIDGNATDALCPVADMLNHRRPRETKWNYSTSREMFVVESLGPLKAGTELLDSYGRKCNTRYLLNYGFCVADNHDADGRCYNEVRFFFALDDADVSFLLKRKLAGGSMYRIRYGAAPASPQRQREGKGKEADGPASSSSFPKVFSLWEHSEVPEPEASVAGLVDDVETASSTSSGSGNGDDGSDDASSRGVVFFGRGARISKHHDDFSSREALSLARFICASAQPGRHRELAALPPLEGVDLRLADECIPPLSRANEADSLALVARLARQQLAKYDPDPDGAGPGSSSGERRFANARQKYAFVLIESEKDVCRHWVRVSELCEPLLRLDLPKVALRRARDLAASDELALPMDGLRRYLELVVMPLLEAAADGGAGN